MSGVGGVVYDKDAVYIDLGGSHSHGKAKQEDYMKPKNEMVASMIDTELTLDQKIEESELQMFSSSVPIKSNEVQADKANRSEKLVFDQEQGRHRRKVVFSDETDEENVKK